MHILFNNCPEFVHLGSSTLRLTVVLILADSVTKLTRWTFRSYFHHLIPHKGPSCPESHRFSKGPPCGDSHSPEGFVLIHPRCLGTRPFSPYQCRYRYEVSSHSLAEAFRAGS